MATFDSLGEARKISNSQQRWRLQDLESSSLLWENIFQEVIGVAHSNTYQYQSDITSVTHGLSKPLMHARTHTHACT